MLALAGRAEAQPVRMELREVHLGVPVRLILHADDSAQGRRAARAAFDRLAALDGALSDYRPDSDLRLLEAAAADTAVAVSEDLFAALGIALRLARETDGAFDPAAGALTRLWREARERGALPDSAAVRAALARGGWQRLRLDTLRRTVRLPAGLQLDLGGIGKGLALQEALRVLAREGVTRALLEAGGDIVVGEPPPGAAGWRVTMLDGEAPQQLARVALATSGPQEQHLDADGRRYSHVLDPRTGWPLTAPEAVSVIAEDGALADALATAFSVLGRARALALAPRWPGLLGFRWLAVADDAR